MVGGGCKKKDEEEGDGDQCDGHAPTDYVRTNQ